ncbi:6-phospho-3-hexuloisomerase [Mammaliicoccus vitulinus]|uniref:6-phospho-3-hexuloisomerase n=1 Tax=Mammaliicoccus vitulinus TaxID=71237 RepID=UPI001C70D782|nr:6-phospho-3-hexuloisomerase [Mammaliicoccus vitulinus]
MNKIKQQILDEITDSFSKSNDNEINNLIQDIDNANKIFIYGLGREKIVLTAFAMRLMHLGYDVHVIGDVTTPAITKGDLLITSSGTGYLSTVEALVNIANNNEARIAFFTAFPDAVLPLKANTIIEIKAQTMKDNAVVDSIQPMGSLFEQTQLLILEYIIVELIQKHNLKEEDMVPNHTNLE